MEKLDVLLTGQFDLTKKGAGFSKNTILLGEQAFLKKFGNPLKASPEYSEEDEANMIHYSHKGADIWYLKITWRLLALLRLITVFKYPMAA